MVLRTAVVVAPAAGAAAASRGAAAAVPAVAAGPRRLLLPSEALRRLGASELRKSGPSPFFRPGVLRFPDPFAAVSSRGPESASRRAQPSCVQQRQRRQGQEEPPRGSLPALQGPVLLWPAWRAPVAGVLPPEELRGRRRSALLEAQVGGARSAAGVQECPFQFLRGLRLPSPGFAPSPRPCSVALRRPRSFAEFLSASEKSKLGCPPVGCGFPAAEGCARVSSEPPEPLPPRSARKPPGAG